MSARATHFLPAVVTRMIVGDRETLLRMEWLGEDGAWGPSKDRLIFGQIEEAYEEAARRQGEGLFVTAVVATRADHEAQEHRRATRVAVSEASLVEERADWRAETPNCGVE